MNKFLLLLTFLALGGCTVEYKTDSYEYPRYVICRYDGGLDHTEYYYYRVEYVCRDGQRYEYWR